MFYKKSTKMLGKIRVFFRTEQTWLCPGVLAALLNTRSFQMQTCVVVVFIYITVLADGKLCVFHNCYLYACGPSWRSSDDSHHSTVLNTECRKRETRNKFKTVTQTYRVGRISDAQMVFWTEWQSVVNTHLKWIELRFHWTVVNSLSSKNECC